MASLNFHKKQCREHSIVDLYLESKYNALIAATASIATTAPIVLTSVASGSARNTKTFKLVVAAAAANPSDTVLVAFTGTAAAIICTVTPNDGTNNTATPVTVTSANLVELINTGLITGKTPTITDTLSLRALQTATGGNTAVLAAGGEGDNKTGTFSGGQDQSFTDISKYGFISIVEVSPGTYRINLIDQYSAVKMFSASIVSAVAQDINFQIKDVSKINDVLKRVDFFTNTVATPTAPANGSIIKLNLEVKNTSII